MFRSFCANAVDIQPYFEIVAVKPVSIQDRDYMRRPRREDSRSDSSPAEKAEAILSALLKKHPRFFLWLGLAVAALAILAFVASKF